MIITWKHQLAQAFGVSFYCAFVIAFFLTPVTPERPLNLSPQSYSTAPVVGKTFVIGDSTTWRLTGEYDNTFNLWNTRHPDWVVDGVGGRIVNKLNERIQYHLDNVDSAPRTFVMALGTNPVPEGETWWKWNYIQALNLLPASTNVVLVIPVRANRQTAEMRAKADDVTRYAGYLREIANERSNTIAAEWRPVVMNDPTKDPVTGVGEWTNDGIHQRNPFGRDRWMDIVEAAVNRF